MGGNRSWVGRMTVDDLLALVVDDWWQYEVVEGVLVQLAGRGDLATTLAATMIIVLGAFIRSRKLGRVTSSNGVFKFPGAETGLIPDVGFYGAEPARSIADRNKPIPFAPELAVEIASPSQNASELAAKARTYLNAGTRLVWAVLPRAQAVDVWRAGTAGGPVVRLGMDDSLDGEDVVPGFRHPIADLFQ